MALCSIPDVLKVRMEISDFISAEAPRFVRQVPSIRISKGNVSIDKPQPYYIVDERTRRPKAIIDTTGSITSLAGTDAVLLLKKNSLLVKKSETETKVFDLSDFDGVSIDRSSMYSLLDWLEQLFPVLLYPFAVLFSIMFRIVEVLILAVIGLLYSKMMNTALLFQTSVRLAAIAITPAVICGALLVLINISIFYWPFISFSLSLGYFFFALRTVSGAN